MHGGLRAGGALAAALPVAAGPPPLQPSACIGVVSHVDIWKPKNKSKRSLIRFLSSSIVSHVFNFLSSYLHSVSGQL